MACVYKFGATWCEPCNQIKDDVETLCAELKLRLIPVDVDENAELAHMYKVSSIPLIVCVDAKGRKYGQYEGANISGIKTLLYQFVASDGSVNQISLPHTEEAAVVL